MPAERDAQKAAEGKHVHEWVDKALLNEPSLKVCKCGATLTDTEYGNAEARV